MRIKVTISMLLLSAAWATPTLANYFYNPHVNIARNIGSAPSPTPRDIRSNRLPNFAHTDRSNRDPSAVDATEGVRKLAKDHQTNLRNGEDKNQATATTVSRIKY